MNARLSIEHIATNRPALLAELDRQQGILRDYVRSVALGYSTGTYLYGRPGTAKTFIVRRFLETEIKKTYAYHSGHLTPIGLFELIAEHPDGVVVLDDIVTVFRSDVALQILLSALDHPADVDPTRPRVVTYRRKGGVDRVNFRGGVVCISNRELHDADLLGAFKSRVHVLNFDPADPQLGALMLDAAEKGPLGIAPHEASTVARFVIGEMIRLGCRFDLRLFFNKALPDYQQWKDGETESDWRDLVTTAIEEHLVAARRPAGRPSRADRKEAEHAILRAILQQHSSREVQVEAWQERTGKSARAFYRRLAEIE
jgi:hypothetical protein